MFARKLESGLILAVIVVALAVFGVACKKSEGGETGGAAASSNSGGGSGAAAGPSSIDHGGITEVPTDPALIAKGEKLYQSKTCNACHAMDQRKVGPPLSGVTERREAAWLARMILHPQEMVEKDPEAKKLFEEYGTPMTTPPVSPEEAKAIIAYLGSKK